MRRHNVKSLKVEVNSSLIKQMEYDYTRYRLKIRFKRGKSRRRVHYFHDISLDHFWHIMNAQSIGKMVLNLIDTSHS